MKAHKFDILKMKKTSKLDVFRSFYFILFHFIISETLKQCLHNYNYNIDNDGPLFKG